ncbi:MAG: hydroxylamine reductase [Bacteroidales bacterium]
MFCYQCQEAAKGEGCTVKGVCGKTPEVSALQDLLVYVCKGISVLSQSDKSKELTDADKFVVDALFVTITNANFDPVAIMQKIKEGVALRDRLQAGVDADYSSYDCVTWSPKSDEHIIAKSVMVGILDLEKDEDKRSLKELVVYGLKGMAAYVEHALNLDYTQKEVCMFMHKALVATLSKDISVDELVALVLECGKFGVDAMSLLDSANTGSFGNPEMTKVNIGVRNNPGILISGHDLNDLEMLLEQTQGTGVDVYTHSEMLPAHYYPKFKKYDNLVGNYGNAWWQQKAEFEAFNGAILFTTNCIVPTIRTFAERVFTTGASGLDGCQHISADKNGHKDFSAVIAKAKECEPPTEIESGEIVGGFAHAQVAALSEQVLGAVKGGDISKFVVMAGCDGRSKKRSYYSDFAEELPNDAVILTAGCAKYRYNKLGLGDIGGIPRVLDAGQCNDSYSLVMIALNLKKALELEDLNELPIVYNIAWYEQKAVIVLLALLYLGVKNIKLGPTLPAFLSPNVAKVLVENFGLSTISDVESDIEWAMNTSAILEEPSC